MPPTGTNVNFNQTGSIPPSKVDLLSGKHTRDLLVVLIILIILGTLLFSTIPEKIVDRLMDAFLALIGFLAGTNTKSKD